MADFLPPLPPLHEAPARRGQAFEPLPDLCRAAPQDMVGGEEEGAQQPPPVSCACKVMLRLRPSEETELGDEGPLTVGPGGRSVVVGGGAACPVYSMDGVFPPHATQDDVFASVRDNIASVLDGFNCTILAYGQTWAGKTYTMFGEDGDRRGIIPRALELVYDKMAQESKGAAFVCKASMMEIHLEDLHDLLRPGACKLRLRESVFAGVWVEGLHQAFVPTANSALELVEKGMARRSAAPTGMNDLSSRSHCIFTLSIECQRQDGMVQSGVLRFADLAGLERLDRTQAEGQCLEEAKRINVSLSALGNCISALAQPHRTHIPFRDSKLTFLLKDSLGGNSKTTLLINCSPRWRDLDESIGAIKFGERARAIKSVVHVNRQLKAEELERLLGKLQKEHSALMKYCASLEEDLAMCRLNASKAFDPSPDTPTSAPPNGNNLFADKENVFNGGTANKSVNKSSNVGSAAGLRVELSKKSVNSSFLTNFLGAKKKEVLGVSVMSPSNVLASPSAAYNIWRRSHTAGSQEVVSSPLRNMDPVKLLLRISELESATVDMQIEIEALSMQRQAVSPGMVAFTSIPTRAGGGQEPSAICPLTPSPTKLEWGIHLEDNPCKDDKATVEAGTQMTPPTSAASSHTLYNQIIQKRLMQNTSQQTQDQKGEDACMQTSHCDTDQAHADTQTAKEAESRRRAHVSACAQTSILSDASEEGESPRAGEPPPRGWLSPSLMPGGDRVQSFLGGLTASTQVTPQRVKDQSKKERDAAVMEAVSLLNKYPPMKAELTKKGRILGGSKQVQCELTKEAFLYQSSREGMRKELKLLGVSRLTSEGEAEFSFLSANRRYVFTAGGKKERDDWVETIHTRMAVCARSRA